MIWFEWDPMKARTNERKHGITFEEAVNVFDDPYALFEQDRTDDKTGEPRWQAIGLVESMVLLLVAHTLRATRKERTRYEQTRAQDVG